MLKATYFVLKIFSPRKFLIIKLVCFSMVSVVDCLSFFSLLLLVVVVVVLLSLVVVLTVLFVVVVLTVGVGG